MKEYRTINKIAGPLVFVGETEPIGYGEMVKVTLGDGSVKNGQVLDTADDLVVVQHDAGRRVASIVVADAAEIGSPVRDRNTL